MAFSPVKMHGLSFATALFMFFLGLKPGAVAEAQDAAQPAARPEGALFERYTDRAQISGVILAGIVSSGRPADTRPLLSARVPRTWGGQRVCVQLVSFDGRYVAKQVYRIAEDWPGGELSLPFESQFAPKLAALSPAEMAVSVSQGDCSTGSDLSIAQWNSTFAADATSLLINSFGADEAYIFVGADPADIACLPVRGPNHLAYDFRCPIPVGALVGDGAVKVEINRVRAGAVDEPEVFTIVQTTD